MSYTDDALQNEEGESVRYMTRKRYLEQRPTLKEEFEGYGDTVPDDALLRVTVMKQGNKFVEDWRRATTSEVNKYR